MKRSSPVWVVVVSVVVAVIANLLIYSAGRMLGGTFVFTSATGSAEVDALTVAGFTALPLAVGLMAVAVLGRWWRWVFPVALVVAPVLEVGSIFGMTLPADFDVVSTLTLASCHVALVPVTLMALLGLRARVAQRASVSAVVI